MRSGIISKIQHYSTKDGPGIRSTVFTMGCNLKCAWCANPELIGNEPKVLYYRERCTGCGRCIKTAVNNSIAAGEDGCIIDREKCTNIMECSQSCFFDAYEVAGYEISQQELFDKLVRDEAFYKKSNGGVTFSGGEPGLQGEFVAGVAKRLRERSIHVALDTAGSIPWEKMKNIVHNVDAVLYDIKSFDREMHIRNTSVPNDLILENARRIAAAGIPMYLRMVIIPEVNDDWDDICKRLEFAERLGDSVKQIDILKYHKLGIGKYVRLGIEYPLNELPECDDGYIEKIYKRALKAGLKATING